MEACLRLILAVRAGVPARSPGKLEELFLDTPRARLASRRIRISVAQQAARSPHDRSAVRRKYWSATEQSGWPRPARLRRAWQAAEARSPFPAAKRCRRDEPGGECAWPSAGVHVLTRQEPRCRLTKNAHRMPARHVDSFPHPTSQPSTFTTTQPSGVIRSIPELTCAGTLFIPYREEARFAGRIRLRLRYILSVLVKK